MVVRALGADAYEAREAAMETLVTLAEEARPALLDALSSDDLEIALRARSVARRMLRPSFVTQVYEFRFLHPERPSRPHEWAPAPPKIVHLVYSGVGDDFERASVRWQYDADWETLVMTASRSSLDRITAAVAAADRNASSSNNAEANAVRLRFYQRSLSDSVPPGAAGGRQPTAKSE